MEVYITAKFIVLDFLLVELWYRVLQIDLKTMLAVNRDSTFWVRIRGLLNVFL